MVKRWPQKKLMTHPWCIVSLPRSRYEGAIGAQSQHGCATQASVPKPRLVHTDRMTSSCCAVSVGRLYNISMRAKAPPTNFNRSARSRMPQTIAAGVYKTNVDLNAKVCRNARVAPSEHIVGGSFRSICARLLEEPHNLINASRH